MRAIFKMDGRSVLHLQGEGAKALLKRLLCGNVRSMTEGAIVFSPMLNMQGGTLDNVMVYCDHENSYWLIVHECSREKDLRHIRRELTPDVTAEDLHDMLCLYAVISEGGNLTLSGAPVYFAAQTDHLGADSKYANIDYKQGDIVNTLITCENGELISIRLDTSLPCYYSRELTVRGTRGMYEEKLGLVLADGWRDTYETQAQLLADAENARKAYEEKYLPEMWNQVSENMAQAGHGGIDYLQFEAFFDALRYGREMPIDVYDAASWMSVAYLSEKSIALGGASVEIPDFTRGAYQIRKPCDVVPLPVVPQEKKESFL